MEEKDLSQKVRIHKHNYAGEFGNVVIDPALTLLKELVANPTAFTLKERTSIIRACCAAYKNLGRYEVLGYDITEQLDSVRDDIVPSIKENHLFFRSLIKDVRDFKDPFVVKVIQWADNDIDDILVKLSNIQYDDKGELISISAYRFIEEIFDDEIDSCSREGQAPFVYEFIGRDLQDIKIMIEPDGFRENVIHNIIENIKKHAFRNTEKEDAEDSLLKKGRVFWFQEILYRLEHFIPINLFPMDVKLHDFKLREIPEKSVRIIFSRDPLNEGRLNIIIENNGEPFEGDVTKIFDYGFRGKDSHGEGIGLYSAADYLKNPQIDGSIKMESTPEKEFKVRFIINLPIYGKQTI